MKHTKRLGLKVARERAGLTQVQLRDRSGVEQNTISRIEAGRIRDPRTSTARNLELALGLAHGTLVFGDEAGL